MNNILSRSNCLWSFATVTLLALGGCGDDPIYYPPVSGSDTGTGTNDSGTGGGTDTGGSAGTVSCTEVCNHLPTLGSDCVSIGDCPSLCEQVSDTVRQCTLDATTCNEAIQCTEGGGGGETCACDTDFDCTPNCACDPECDGGGGGGGGGGQVSDLGESCSCGDGEGVAVCSGGDVSCEDVCVAIDGVGACTQECAASEAGTAGNCPSGSICDAIPNFPGEYVCQ